MKLNWYVQNDKVYCANIKPPCGCGFHFAAIAVTDLGPDLPLVAMVPQLKDAVTNMDCPYA